MNILIKDDITQLTPSVRWSGDYQQAARTLDLSVLASATDKNIPVVACDLGSAITMLHGGEILFSGFIVSRTKSTEGNTIDLTCYDRGFYLKRNQAIYKFTNVAPEAAVAQVAKNFGIETGYLTPTGVKISRNFLSGSDSLYDIMLTLYTLASKTTNKQYHIGFRGAKLYVTVKEPDNRTLIIQGKSNLISANTTESISQMVNAVKIYSASGDFVRELKSDSDIKLYGRLQEALKQTKGDDKVSEAQKILNEGGVSQKITVDCLGNTANITGGTVVVQEPYTGICGLFYIESDTHEWKRGQYYNKLVLNFKNIMNAKEAGELPNADGSKTSGGATEASYQWKYIGKSE